MNQTYSLCSLLLLLTLAPSQADVLELKDGTVLNGRYAGGSAATVRFETSAGLQVIETGRIIAITFTSTTTADSVPAAQPLPATVPVLPAPTVLPSAAAQPQAAPATIVVPAGTTILVRMVDSISSKNAAGTPFSAKLERDLGANNVVAVKAGASIYGKVQSSSQAGRALGRSTLELRLTQVSAGSQAVPILTSGHKQAGQASVAQTARGAGAGAAIGAIAGDAGKGAAIGAAAGALGRGETISVPAGTLLEFTLSQAVTIPVSR